MEYQFSQNLLLQSRGEDTLEKGMLGHSCYEWEDGESRGPALTEKGEQVKAEVKGMENE